MNSGKWYQGMIMFGFGKDKKEKEMEEIKKEMDKPIDGPISSSNNPIYDKVSDINDKGEWSEQYRTPPGIAPAITPPLEPAPANISEDETWSPPVKPIRRAPDMSDRIEDGMEEMASHQMQSSKGQENEAPLFIRVDKYSDLLAHVKEMKTFLGSFKKTLDVLRDIETAKDDALKILRASANRLERVLETADQELLKPDIEDQVETAGKEEAAHVEDTLEGLKSEINNLKSELKRLE